MKITADEGPSYSSPSRTVDLRAKVMQQLQQAFGHRRRASACMRVCHNHLQLQPVTPSPFFLSISLRHLSPFSFFFFYHPSCFAVCMHRIHNPIHLSVFTTHVDAPCWHGIKRRESDLVCISQHGGRPALASLSTYEMKSDAGDACP